MANYQATLSTKLDWAESIGVLSSWSNERPSRVRVYHLHFKHGLELHLTAKEAHLWVSGLMTGFGHGAGSNVQDKTSAIMSLAAIVS